jgi:ATP-dependent Clp protease ATP-binding subunit ClpA
MFERYTELALRTLFFARYEASRLAGVSVETGHVLLAVLRESGAVASRIFGDVDLSYQEVEQLVTAATPARPKVPTSVEMPFAADTLHVLAHATEEADALGHARISTEHILLGLLRERGSFAERALADAGLSIDRVRGRIRDDGAPTEKSTSLPSRAEALAALERIGSRLADLRQADHDVRSCIEGIELELDLVRRALQT